MLRISLEKSTRKFRKEQSMARLDLKKIQEVELPKLIQRLEDSGSYIINGDDIKLKGDFYEKQVRVALRNFDVINPESLEEYIARDGYKALEKVIFDLDPEEVIETLIDSKLRGRGGAGFPLGIKWKGAFDQNSEKKYVVCNGDEGDPGAYMDRSILEGDPHVLIEAMTICAKVIGADEGYVYVRAEYPKAVQMLDNAIKVAKENNLLGDNILGSDFSFDLKIRLGAGAFVCGEETALINSIEGNRGIPTNKPPYPTEAGLNGKPTVLNNVETYANVPRIILKGSDWFKSIGTEDSPGTKVFALVGKVNNSGLVEVPMGMTINEIVFDIGGGVGEGRHIKAVQTGGPSGGCIPEHLLDAKVDFASLAEIGSIMGSGGMVVMDDTDCMVDIAKYFMDFTVDESCGKCTPCRIGNKRILEILERITSGTGVEEDIGLLEELSHVIIDTSVCGLGKSAPNPVISSLKYFMEEYEEHIHEGKCRAGICKDLLDYKITDKCIGCQICKKQCPTNAISGEAKSIHEIDQEACIKCGVCMDKCPIDAIVLD